MLQEITSIELQADVISCSAVISACEKGACWEAALGWWRQIVNQFLIPDLVSCNVAMSAYEIISKELQPDVVSCSAAISACEKGA